MWVEGLPGYEQEPHLAARDGVAQRRLDHAAVVVASEVARDA